MTINELEYLHDHHHITETGVGLAKLYLKSGEHKKALDVLEKCSTALKDLKNQATTQKMEEVKSELK